MSTGTNKERIEQNNTLLEDIKTQIQNLPEGGGTVEGIKQFASVEEMNNSTGNKEGDLAVVYRSEVNNVTVDSKFQIATFPETVVLDTALTDNIEVRYRAVDSSKTFDCWGQLDSNMFMMDCYTESGSIRIVYESSDSITYTRTRMQGDSGNLENPVDFGTEIYYEMPEMWNDAIGYFMQIESNAFYGLYIYENSSWKIAPNQFTLTENKMLPGTTGYGKNGVTTGTNAVYELLDYDLVNKQVLNRNNEFELVQVGSASYASMSITPFKNINDKLKTKDYFGFINNLDLSNTPDTTLYSEELINENTITLNHAYLDYSERKIYAPVADTSSYNNKGFTMNVLDMDTGNILRTVSLTDTSDLTNATVHNSFKVGNYIYLPISINSSTSSKDAGIKLYKYDIANNTITTQYKKTSTSLGATYNTTSTGVGAVDNAGNIYALVYNSSGFILHKITLSGTATKLTTFSSDTKNVGRNVFPSKYVPLYDSTNLLFAYNVETGKKVLIPVDYSGTDSSGKPENIKIFEAGENTILLMKYMNDFYLAVIDKDENVTVKYQSKDKVSNASYYVTDTIPSMYFETEKICFVPARYGAVCVDVENTTIATILEVRQPMFDLKLYNNYIEYKSINSNKFYSGKCLPIRVEPLLSSDFFGYRNGDYVYIRQSDLTRLFGD